MVNVSLFKINGPLLASCNFGTVERAVRLGDAPTFNRRAGSQGSVEVRFLTSPPHLKASNAQEIALVAIVMYDRLTLRPAI